MSTSATHFQHEKSEKSQTKRRVFQIRFEGTLQTPVRHPEEDTRRGEIRTKCTFLPGSCVPARMLDKNIRECNVYQAKRFNNRNKSDMDASFRRVSTRRATRCLWAHLGFSLVFKAAKWKQNCALSVRPSNARGSPQRSLRRIRVLSGSLSRSSVSFSPSHEQRAHASFFPRISLLPVLSLRRETRKSCLRTCYYITFPRSGCALTLWGIDLLENNFCTRNGFDLPAAWVIVKYTWNWAYYHLGTKIMNLLLLDSFYPVTSYRQVRKESDELLYTVLVTRYGPQSVTNANGQGYV